MPLDTSIPGRVGQGVTPIASPVETYGRILGIKDKQQEQELQRQQIESNRLTMERNARTDQQNAAKYASDTAADSALAKLLAENTVKGDDGQESTNYPAVIRGLAKAGHGAKALSLETQWRADQKTQNETLKAQIENAQKTLGMSASALGALVNVPDEQLPAAYEQSRQQLLQTGLYKPEQLPDFATIQQQSNGKPRDWFAQQQQRGVEAEKQVGQAQKDREFQQHLLEKGPEIAAAKLKTVGDELKTAGQLLGPATSQAQWDAGLEWLRQAGVSKNALDQIGAEYSPEAAKAAAERALTTQERTTRDDKLADNARALSAQQLAERRAQETERHNQRMEERTNRILESGLTTQMNTAINSIANQFDNEPTVKRYSTIQEADGFVKRLGTGDKATSTDDQGLIYAFAKAMDPDSVVREGEYNTVQKYAQSWAESLGFDAKRVFSNTPFLTDQARKQIKDTIGKKVAESKASYDKTKSGYASRIEAQTGAKDGAQYLVDFDRAEAGAGKHRITVNGKTYEYKGTGATDDMANYAEVKP